MNTSAARKWLAPGKTKCYMTKLYKYTSTYWSCLRENTKLYEKVLSSVCSGAPNAYGETVDWRRLVGSKALRGDIRLYFDRSFLITFTWERSFYKSSPFRSDALWNLFKFHFGPSDRIVGWTGKAESPARVVASGGAFTHAHFEAGKSRDADASEASR